MAITEQTLSMIKKVTFDWTCTTGGVVSDTTTKSYDGEVLRVVFGDTAATGYALVINDEDSIDILGGAGATLTSGGSQLGINDGKSPISCVAISALTLGITGGGNATTGQTIVYIR